MTPAFPAASDVTILIVAPPTLQRQGLLATLREGVPALTLTTTANPEALPDLLRREGPTLLILDASLSGSPLPELLEKVRIIRPSQRVLVLGGRRLPFRVSRLIVEMGGGLLLARRATPADLLEAVTRLIGETDVGAVDETFSMYGRRSSASQSAVVFSPRELEILRLVAADCTSQEIAAHLFISIRTVDAHRRGLLEKAGVRSMVGLVLQAVRSGWLEMV